MSDDDIEARLRRALQAKAAREVGVDSPLPDMRTAGPVRRRPPLAPMLAAAAVVAALAGGSVWVAQASPHHDRTPLATTETPTTPPPDQSGTGTLTPPPVTLTPSDTPTPSRTRPPSHSRSHGPSAPASTTRAAAPPPTLHTSHHHTAPPSTPTSSTPKSGEPCTTAALTLSIGGDRMAPLPGDDSSSHLHDYTILDVRNTGVSCTLDGWPTATVRTGSGTAIDTSTHRSSPAPTSLLLAHGARAEFELYDYIDTGRANCDPDYGVGRTLDVTVPGRSTPITIDYGYSGCQLSVTAFHLPEDHPVTD